MRLTSVETIAAVRSVSEAAAAEGRSTGFVPTMGALHDGHAHLIRAARADTDQVVVSIFVNPLQFDRAEDLARYPRTVDADLRLCDIEGVDVVFAPSVDEMYPVAPACTIHVGRLADHLCGAHRPGHFDGMATVVLKLLQIVAPSRAYFGEKDAQQLAIIRRMARDLNLPSAIVGVPTVREPDGLALSSRNRHLNAEERALAASLHALLRHAAEAIAGGERSGKALIAEAVSRLPAHPALRLEYLQLVDTEELQPVERVAGPVLVAGALWVGRTRLIDNIVVTP